MHRMKLLLLPLTLFIIENSYANSYGDEVDALYIRLVGGERECRVVRLMEDILHNMGGGLGFGCGG